MAPRTRFVTYQPKTILNKSKRADHWFWTRYGAYPYLGCQHGCAFCYSRERKYLPHKPQDINAIYDEEADEFSHLIKVKENGPHLLRKALERVPIDMVFTGDYQPAEKKFRISRRMLEVCLELGFPVFVLTRSPLVLRDLDILQAINKRSRAVVAFSIIATPETDQYAAISRLEGLAPKAEKRFNAMEQVNKVGIQTGTVAMPLLPGLCDTDHNLQVIARWTADHGGSFVLGGGLTLADQQKQFFMHLLERNHPELVTLYQSLYPERSYAQMRPWRKVGLRLREDCQKLGISDRIPRPIIPGEKKALNKRIVERLAYELHTLDLENAAQSQMWAYRKASWAVEDLDQDIGLIYRSMGKKGLESIQGVNQTLAKEIERLIQLEKSNLLDGNLV